MIHNKINIGCGYDKRVGYLNIDSDPACCPDILIVENDLSVLPANHFDLAIALDVLEHIPRIHMMSALYDWVKLLKLGGKIFVETSYIFGIIDVMRAAGDFETIHNWKRCLFGNQAHPGDWHCNGFSEQTLVTYLRAVGLTIDSVSIRDNWLIQVWSTKEEDLLLLEDIKDYSEFLECAHSRLLGRSPEPFKYANISEANSLERRIELKSLICSEERLYKIGKERLNLAVGSTTGAPTI